MSKLLSLQEAVAECVADPSLAFRAWTGGNEWFHITKIREIEKVKCDIMDSSGFTLRFASEVLTYWQVKPLAEVEKELGLARPTVEHTEAQP